MLKRSFRLQKKDIERLYKKGRAIREDLFLVRVAPNRAEHCRFAIVISKKVLSLATDRNKARRKIYQRITELERFWLNKNLDMAFFLKKYDEAGINNSLNKFLSELK